MHRTHLAVEAHRARLYVLQRHRSRAVDAPSQRAEYADTSLRTHCVGRTLPPHAAARVQAAGVAAAAAAAAAAGVVAG